MYDKLRYHVVETMMVIQLFTFTHIVMSTTPIYVWMLAIIILNEIDGICRMRGNVNDFKERKR